MKFKIVVKIVLLLCSYGNAVSAHLNKVHSEAQFYRTINKRSIALVFFYQEDKDTRKNPQLKRTISSSLAMLERISRLPWYDDGDCIFVIVNVVTQELMDLMRSLKIFECPSYLLFYNSVIVSDEQGNSACLRGFVPRDTLESFIDRYVGGSIEDAAKERAEQRRLARQEARERYEYYAPSFYWGYPYWGCWGGGPGFGFGMGFGCGY